MPGKTPYRCILCDQTHTPYTHPQTICPVCGRKFCIDSIRQIKIAGATNCPYCVSPPTPLSKFNLPDKIIEFSPPNKKNPLKNKMSKQQREQKWKNKKGALIRSQNNALEKLVEKRPRKTRPSKRTKYHCTQAALIAFFVIFLFVGVFSHLSQQIIATIFLPSSNQMEDGRYAGHAQWDFSIKDKLTNKPIETGNINIYSKDNILVEIVSINNGDAYTNVIYYSSAQFFLLFTSDDYFTWGTTITFPGLSDSRITHASYPEVFYLYKKADISAGQNNSDIIGTYNGVQVWDDSESYQINITEDSFYPSIGIIFNNEDPGTAYCDPRPYYNPVLGSDQNGERASYLILEFISSDYFVMSDWMTGKTLNNELIVEFYGARMIVFQKLESEGNIGAYLTDTTGNIIRGLNGYSRITDLSLDLNLITNCPKFEYIDINIILASSFSIDYSQLQETIHDYHAQYLVGFDFWQTTWSFVA